MEQNAAEKEASAPGELTALEAGLKGLWDRIRQAGETITRLREERTTLQSRMRELEATVAELEQTIGRQRTALSSLETRLKEMPPPSAGGFSNGEREALAARLRELLARIEAYL